MKFKVPYACINQTSCKLRFTQLQINNATQITKQKKNLSLQFYFSLVASSEDNVHYSLLKLTELQEKCVWFILFFFFFLLKRLLRRKYLNSKTIILKQLFKIHTNCFMLLKEMFCAISIYKRWMTFMEWHCKRTQ